MSTWPDLDRALETRRRGPGGCRVCGGEDLRVAFDLGDMPLANRLLTREQFLALPGVPEPRYPLALAVCACSFVQLTRVVPPEVLYADYPYATGTSEELRQHFAELAADVFYKAGLQRGGLAVDIGSNDGTLLAGFRALGMDVLGIEPAENLAARARENWIPTWMEFFGDATVKRIVLEDPHRFADVVTATNVLTHVDDALGFLRNVRSLLFPRGVFAAEMYYLPSLLASGTFDLVYHEHLSYFTARTLLRLLGDAGLEAFHLEVVPVHGGSLRVYAGLPGTRPVRDSVREVLDAEPKPKEIPVLLEELREKAERTRWALRQFVDKVHVRNGKRIVGYGAAAKATTLLNYCGVGIESVEYIVDDNAWKQGRYVPGVHVPIVGPEVLEAAYDLQGTHVLIFAWNLADEIAKKLAPLKERGARLFVPLPELREV